MAFNADNGNSLEGKYHHMELTEQKILQIQFESVHQCEAWYKEYAATMGFDIRRRDSRPDKSGQVVMRKWVCSHEGERDKIHFNRVDRQLRSRDATRQNGMAKFNVKRDNASQKWVVTQVFLDHTHPLAPPPYVCFLPTHRCLNDSQKSQAKAMSLVGITPSKFMDLQALEAGGYDRLCFTRTDLNNYLQSERKESIGDGDAESTLSLLRDKKDVDPSFFYSTKIIHDRLESVFWADSISRLDYACFGDVLVFDTTYKTNAYNKPLVILLGVNHHYQSIIFGAALLQDETYEAYKWLLEEFLNAMKWKVPISVITDGDQTMLKAIQDVFPHARHRLCVWHLQRNAQSNVPKHGFVSDFKRCMLDAITPKEFTLNWRAMVAKYGVQENKWVKTMYKKHEMWAEAYQRGHFWGDARSTQRCEGMHSRIKKYLQRKLRLHEFMGKYDMALNKIRHKEAEANHLTENSAPILTTQFHDIEKHTSTVFTRAMFRKVVAEIEKEHNLFLVRNSHGCVLHTYTVECKNNPSLSWDVDFHKTTHDITCSCLMFQTVGIPCSHAFHVMKAERLKKIPQNLIKQRWTRLCKPDVSHINHTLIDSTEMVRYASLSNRVSKVCFLASKSNQGYNELDKEILRWTHRMEEFSYCVNSNKDDCGGPSGIKDPTIARTKGARITGKQVQRRKCMNCKNEGHNKRSCPYLPKAHISSCSDDNSHTTSEEDTF